jgi:hypothetical protein
LGFVDIPKLLAATNDISRRIGRPPVSRVAAAITAKPAARYDKSPSLRANGSARAAR